MLHVVSVGTEQARELGGGIGVAEAARVFMAAGLTFLVMRQVMPMAAGLASGLALSTFGLVSQGLSWAFGRAARSTGQFARGAFLDRDTSRGDSLSRKTGYLLTHWVTGGARRL